MRFDGQIAVGEGSRWAARACARLNDRPLIYIGGIAGSLLAAWVGLFSASWAVDHFGVPGWLYLPIFLGVMWPAVMLLMRGLSRLAVLRYRRKLSDRGLPDPLLWRFESDEDGFVQSVGNVENRVKWSAVSEVFPVGPYWILLVQGSAIFIPKRHIGGVDAERAFVGEVLRHLTPEGRSRSAAAVRLADAPQG